MVPPRRTIQPSSRDRVIQTVIVGLLGLLCVAWGFVFLNRYLEWGLV